MVSLFFLLLLLLFLFLFLFLGVVLFTNHDDLGALQFFYFMSGPIQSEYSLHNM